MIFLMLILAVATISFWKEVLAFLLFAVLFLTLVGAVELASMMSDHST